MQYKLCSSLLEILDVHLEETGWCGWTVIPVHNFHSGDLATLPKPGILNDPTQIFWTMYGMHKLASGFPVVLQIMEQFLFFGEKKVETDPKNDVTY